MVFNSNNGNGNPQALIRHGVALIDAAALDNLITEASNAASMMLCTEDPNVGEKYPALRDAVQIAAAGRLVLAGGAEVVPIDEKSVAISLGLQSVEALGQEMRTVRDMQQAIDRMESYCNLAVDYVKGLFRGYIKSMENRRDTYLNVILRAVRSNGDKSVTWSELGTVAVKRGASRVVETPPKDESGKAIPLTEIATEGLVEAGIYRRKPAPVEPDKEMIGRILGGQLEVEPVFGDIIRERFTIETGPDKPIWKMPGERTEREIRLLADAVTVEKAEVAA